MKHQSTRGHGGQRVGPHSLDRRARLKSYLRRPIRTNDNVMIDQAQINKWRRVGRVDQRRGMVCVSRGSLFNGSIWYSRWLPCAMCVLILEQLWFMVHNLGSELGGRGLCFGPCRSRVGEVLPTLVVMCVRRGGVGCALFREDRVVVR